MRVVAERCLQEICNRLGCHFEQAYARDNSYELYDESVIAEAIKRFPDIPEFEQDDFDCDDISDFIKIQFRLLLKGCCVAYVRSYNTKEAHAWIAVLTDKKKLVSVLVERDMFRKRRAFIDESMLDFKKYPIIDKVLL